MANNNHFQLTLDTLAPDGSISRGTNLFVNANFNLTITKGDATFMYIWFDSKSSGSKEDMPATPIAAATSKATEFTTEGTFYYHMVLMDDVGNQSDVKNTDVIVYDVTRPEVTSVKVVPRYYAIDTAYPQGRFVVYSSDGTLAKDKFYMATADISEEENTSWAAVSSKFEEQEDCEITTTREVAVRFTGSDDSSGLASCSVYDDINESETKWSSTLTSEELAVLSTGGYVTRKIVLSGTGSEYATKTVGITLTDSAGNESTKETDTMVLDTEILVGHIVLKDAAETKIITNQWVNVADFKIQLDASSASDWKGYKVWGDFNADGGATGTSKPANFTDLTDAEKTAKYVIISKKWTSGDDASKKVRAEIIDTAGNITVLGTNYGTETADYYEYASVDYSAPSSKFTIKPNTDGRIETHVSKVSGFTTLVLVPEVNGEISGIYGYQWLMNGVNYPNGAGTGTPGEFTVSSDNMGDEGEKVFTLIIKDNAGNTTTSDGVSIWLDLTPPAGTITMNEWYGGDAVDTASGFHVFSTANVTATAVDGPATEAWRSGVKFMTCWCSAVENDTTVTGTKINYYENPLHRDVSWLPEGDYATAYVHIQYEDAVGNTAIMHSNKFGIDITCDQPGAIAFTKEAYPSTSAAVINTVPNSTSSIAAMKVWGDITSAATEAAATWETFSASKSVTLTTGDGTKNIYIRYRDQAGNVSVNPAATDETELDTSKPSTTISLYVSGTSDAKPAVSNVKESDAHVTCSESTTGKEFYQIYGDFTTDGTQAAQGLSYHACTLYKENTAYVKDELVLHEGDVYAATAAITAAENTGWSAISSKMTVNTDYWKEFIPETGKDYKNIATVCTSGDGQKVFYSRVMDNAGNISEAASTSFEYDTTAPEATVSDVDHNNISKVHSLRLKNDGGTISELTTYNDETKFKTTPNSDCQAYKVCAYVDAEAARKDYPASGTMELKNAWVESQTPIKQVGDEGNHGSTNMHATGIEFGPNKSTKLISHMIRGWDYEDALGGITKAGDKDGIHYVVVYVQDLGGTWSVAAEFNA